VFRHPEFSDVRQVGRPGAGEESLGLFDLEQVIRMSKVIDLRQEKNLGGFSTSDRSSDLEHEENPVDSPT
jgi:hypothetical protein